ncbi:MAG: FHA domain-containing protein [Myxococcota bacterium]
MIRSYMMSFLTNRLLLLKEKFGAQHAGPWLVWEPGDWHAPLGRAATVKTIILEKNPSAPAKGDALCFQLAASKPSLKVGRDPGCDVVLNDATVSREHLRLEKDAAGAWWAQPTSSERPVRCQDQVVAFGAKVQLHSGARLDLGGAQLTFYDTEALVGRLRSGAKP